ncbi:MAG: cytochrome c-type biogenesis protein CcmH [Nitrosomonadales bacterium]|jgi:cytochrome c-type biogenesis protein CcmH|nr:MAG: cytochrome c-type biogenesis protein CcmH [Nitrosomonadales bacterium]
MNLRSFLKRIRDYGQSATTCLRKLFYKRQFILLLVILIAPSLGWAKEALPVAENPEIEKRMITLSEELRCLVCQNESLAGSRSDFAKDIRREIREQLIANKSDKEITDFLVARYGDFVLYRPPVRSNTMLLWFGPFILLLIGAGVLIIYLKQRRKLLVETPLSNEQLKQAEALLNKSSDGDSA